jgi:putative ABC transport system permease protein
MKLALLALKNLVRHRLRSLLTILGVSAGMFLYASVQTMQHSLAVATEAGAADTTLVVYRENRFCPATSRLPEHYLSVIERIPGVRQVIPIQIAVNNCGASLDVITFRGVPPETLRSYNPDINVVEGAYEDFLNQSDGALVGQHFARRRGLSPGDTFEAVGVNVTVAGIIASNSPQDENVAYVHLPFLQQASRVGLGVVTQFNVKVESAELLQPVAEKIDETFAADQQPTHTRPEKAFFAETAKELIQLIGFTRWLGLGAVVAVAALVANALVLIVRSRVKENAVLRTLGYPSSAIGCLVVSEGGMLGLIGSIIGVGGSALFLSWQNFTMGNEGLTLAIQPKLAVIFGSLIAGSLLGLFASFWPAFQAARQPLITSLRD